MFEKLQSLLNGQTTGANPENDIVMQALQEAEMNPLHDLDAMKRELAEEQAKNKQLTGHLKNQYSKISRLRKTYQDHLQAAENEQFRSIRANQQHLDEKKKLQETNEAQKAEMLELTGQVEVYKSALEASKSEAKHYERLLGERDRAFRALKTELKSIQAKLKGLSNERIFCFDE